MYGNSNTFGVALKKDDEDHLIEFVKFLKVEGNLENIIHYDRKTKSSRVLITRKTTYQDLVRHGFSANKTYDNNLDVWNNIPLKFKKDFILGLWDGDGNFSISNTENKNLSSLISNNELLLKEISLYINYNLGDGFSKVKPRTKGDKYPRIRFSRNKAKLFGDWLYKDSVSCYMVRKYNEYTKMKLGSKAHKGFDNWTVKGILCIDSNKIYVTLKECCMGEFGIDNPGTCNNIGACCRGERNKVRNKHFRYLTKTEKEMFLNGKFNI